MKKLLIILSLLFAINLGATTPTNKVVEPTEIAQVIVYPGVHYTHKVFVSDQFINGRLHYAQWYQGYYNNGVVYFYFYWQPY